MTPKLASDFLFSFSFYFNSLFFIFFSSFFSLNFGEDLKILIYCECFSRMDFRFKVEYIFSFLQFNIFSKSHLGQSFSRRIWLRILKYLILSHHLDWLGQSSSQFRVNIVIFHNLRVKNKMEKMWNINVEII